MKRVAPVLLCLALAALAWAGQITGYDTATLSEQVQTPEIHGTAEATLTDNTASDILTINLADGEIAGGIISGSIHVTDATPDYQAMTTEVTWAAVRKGGTVTADIASASTTESTAVSAGTIVTVGGTNGWSVTTSGTGLTIKLTANTSLTPTDMHFHYTVYNNHDSTVTYP